MNASTPATPFSRLSTMLERIVDEPRHSNQLIAAGGLLLLFIGASGVVGWLTGVPALVQLSPAFAAFRPLTAFAVMLCGAAAMAIARNARGVVRLTAISVVVLAIAGTLPAVANVQLPGEPWFAQRAASMGIEWYGGIPLVTVTALLAFASGLLLANRQLRGSSGLVVYALGIVIITYASMLTLVQVSDVSNGHPEPAMGRLGIPSAVALITMGAVMVALAARVRVAPLTPPRWVPVFVATMITALVVVLRFAMREENRANIALEESIAAVALEQRIESAFEDVERMLLRLAVQHGDGGSGVSRDSGVDVFPTSVLAWAIMDRGASTASSTASWIRSGQSRELLTLLTSQPWRVEEFDRSSERMVYLADSANHLLGVYTSVYSRSFTGAQPRVLAALVDEQRLLELAVRDSLRGYRAVFLDHDVYNATDTAGAYLVSHRFGNRVIPVALVSTWPRPGTALPDVVLALGLGIAVLLGISLQFLRTVWAQARAAEAARLQVVFDNASDGLWEYHFPEARGRRSATQLRRLGYDPDQFNRKPEAWADLIHPDDRDRVFDVVGRNRNSTLLEVDELSYRVLAADGTWHNIADRGYVVERDADKRPLVMLGVSADVTAHRQLEAERAASEQRFRTMFEAAQQFQALVDSNGRCLEVNAAALHMAGASRDVLVDTALADGPWWRSSPDARKQLSERLAKTIEGTAQRFELTTRLPDNRSVLLDVTCTPIAADQTDSLQVLVEARDITERRRVEQALREIGSLTTIGRLAARVAHEINNPLAGIQNSFLLLADSIPQDHPHRKFVGAIEREIQRIAVVTRQLYETYRPDQDSTSNASVVLAVNEAVTFLDQVNRGRGVRIVADITSAPPSLPVPDALLRQTLYNLVQNAVEAAPKQSQVAVVVTTETDSCVITVHDERAEVSPDIRRRLRGGDESPEAPIKATSAGLGLALVRHSVEAVGGTISLLDEGSGATFVVRLPLTPVTGTSNALPNAGEGLSSVSQPLRIEEGAASA